jgi:hypothetical protein
MGLFGKKKDPLNDRENSLNAEIESLEEQIERLKTVLGSASNVSETHDQSAAAPARPGGAGRALGRPDADPVFEPVDQNRLHDTKTPNPFSKVKEPRSIHNEGSVSFWEKLTRFFRGPTSSNPKLVNYLAAGNIHGLRPLRYEKRIHRNRTLLWVGILLVALIGLIKMLIR